MSISLLRFFAMCLSVLHSLRRIFSRIAAPLGSPSGVVPRAANQNFHDCRWQSYHYLCWREATEGVSQGSPV